MKLVRYFAILLAALSLAASPQPKKLAAPGKAVASAAAQAKLIDINAASEQELKQLPGIGDAYAAKIVQNRPYRAKNQLAQKNIIPGATYDKIKDLIIARQAGGGAKTAPPKKK